MRSAISALLAAFLLVAAATAFAESGKLKQAVSVRERPGETYRVIGKLAAGAKVDIARRKDAWVKLSGARGGWIPASAVAAAGAEPATPVAKAPPPPRAAPARKAPRPAPVARVKPPRARKAARVVAAAAPKRSPAASPDADPFSTEVEHIPARSGRTTPPPEEPPPPPARKSGRSGSAQGDDEFASLEEARPASRRRGAAPPPPPPEPEEETEPEATEPEEPTEPEPPPPPPTRRRVAARTVQADDEPSEPEEKVTKRKKKRRPAADEDEEQADDEEPSAKSESIAKKPGRTGPLFDLFATGGYALWNESVSSTVDKRAVPLSTYGHHTGAFGVITGGGLGYNAGGFMMFGDVAYRYFGASPGIKVTNKMDGSTTELAVVAHGVDAGLRLGVRTNVVAVYGRVGYAYNLINLSFAEEAPLSWDLVRGFVVGAGLDVLRLGSRGTLRLRGDIAVTPQREQDETLTDGETQVTRAISGGALLGVRLGKTFGLVLGGHLRYVDSKFEGMSQRLKDASIKVMDTNRTTTVLMGTFGLGWLL